MSDLLLQPCPFCGGEPTIQTWPKVTSAGRLIACSNGENSDENGGCSVGPFVSGITEAEAVSRWNRRLAVTNSDWGNEKLTPDEAWTTLCETPDITSPAEYPDHALITREQLQSYMERALPLSGTDDNCERVRVALANLVDYYAGTEDAELFPEEASRLAQARAALEGGS